MEQKDQPELSRRILLKHVFDGDEVLQRLGHLASGDGQVTRMQEVTNPVVVVVVGLK